MEEEEPLCGVGQTLGANGWRITVFCGKEPNHYGPHAGSVVSGEHIFAPGTTIVEWT